MKRCIVLVVLLIFCCSATAYSQTSGDSIYTPSPELQEYIRRILSDTGAKAADNMITLAPPPAPTYTSPSPKRDKRWKYVTESIENKFFYDKESIKKRGRIVTVWIREEPNIIPIAKSWLEREKERQRKKPYTLRKDEYDCNEERMRILSITEYDNNDKILNSTNYPNPEWSPIVPESIGEGLLKIFCK